MRTKRRPAQEASATDGGKRSKNKGDAPATPNELPAAPGDPQLSKFAKIDLTSKQWLYLQTVQELIGRGPLPPQKQIAEMLRIRAETISVWNRQTKFLSAYRQVLTENVKVGDLLCDLANQRQAQQGNIKAYELNLRRRGLYDPMPIEPEFDRAAATAQAGVSITFLGLPPPPTRAQVAAQAPPAGANIIVPAPHVPGATSREPS